MSCDTITFCGFRVTQHGVRGSRLKETEDYYMYVDITIALLHW